MVIDEDYLSPGLLIEKVHALYCSRQTYIDADGKKPPDQCNSFYSGNYKRDNGLNMNKKRCANERFGRKQPFLLGTAVSRLRIHQMHSAFSPDI